MFDIKDTISGAFGSLCLVAGGLPFDTAKSRIQTQHTNVYKGPIDCIIKMARHEGIGSLWKGFTPAFSSACLENMVLFSGIGIVRRLFMKLNGTKEISLFQEALSGSTAGIVSATVICPPEMIKVKMQCQKNVGTKTIGHNAVIYRSSFDCLKQVAKAEGLKGIFKGLSPLLARDIPFHFFFFGTYETVNFLLTKVSKTRKSKAELSPAHLFFSGGLAGGFAWAIVYPFDTCKSEMQKSIKTESFGKVLKGFLKEGGIKRLYCGYTAALLRAYPANASLLVGYELCQRFFKWFETA
eukprot:TRINITY_DN10763_c0_g1_i1.p1 TRINITY_DN10763_c0_g1~~TRINITY_DN10763_c0_g1_i1.p1  ORF type:complete len:296 (+),score=50.35 TRINITY_DN10763_c0_g1_i1:122-1009(+)